MQKMAGCWQSGGLGRHIRSQGRGWLGRAGCENRGCPHQFQELGAPARLRTGPALRVSGFVAVGSRESGSCCGLISGSGKGVSGWVFGQGQGCVNLGIHGWIITARGDYQWKVPRPPWKEERVARPGGGPSGWGPQAFCGCQG